MASVTEPKASGIAAAQSPFVLCDKEGYLEKDGGSVKSWKQRWFVLAGTTLSYYKVRGDDKPAGTIDLAQDSKIDVVDDFHRKKKHEYLFAVRQPQRTYNLIAGDYDTRREWVDAIEQAMKKDAASRSSLVLPSTSARPAVVLGAPIPSSATASSGALAPAADKPLPHELKMMHRFLGNNTSNLKVQVQQVVKRATDGEALLAAMKDLVELVGLVIYDCYNLASVQVGDRRVQASLLRHAEVIESAFRHVLATAKVLATQLASNAPGEQIQSLKEQLESTVAVLAGHLDKLVSQNSDADAKVSSVEEAALSSEPRIIKDTRVVSAAESIQRANQSLDAALEALQIPDFNGEKYQADEYTIVNLGSPAMATLVPSK